MTLSPLKVDQEASLGESALSLLSSNKNISRQDFLAALCTHPQYTQFLTNFDCERQVQDSLIHAFFHTSFIHEFSFLNLSSNERSEFLGDSVLGLYIADQIYRQFPTMKEGEMSRLKSSLVNEDSLHNLASLIGLDRLVILGRGELARSGHLNPSILSDAFEAVLGVIFSLNGTKGTDHFLNCVLKKYEESHNSSFISEDRLKTFDAKTRLQEVTMALYKEHPVYQFTQLEDQTFDVDVIINDKKILSMNHISKKKAEKLLATKILNEELYRVRGE